MKRGRGVCVAAALFASAVTGASFAEAQSEQNSAQDWFQRPEASELLRDRASDMRNPAGERESARRSRQGKVERETASALWEKAPSWADLIAANPTAGGARPVAGRVGLRCRMEETGLLEACQVIEAQPKGRRFDAAARRLAQSFEIVNDAAYRRQAAGAYLNLTIAFPDPAQPIGPRRLAKPVWKRLISPKLVLNLFPAAAHKAGVGAGRGTLECVAAEDGALDQCRIVAEAPAGLGFGATALSIARAMQLNPWTAQGEPVGGALVSLPILLKLPEGERPATPAAQ